MRTTLNLDDRLLARAKRLAAERGSTLTALIEEGLREVVTTHEAPGVYRLELPVVRGEGASAVDVADRDRLFEAMDDSTPG